LIDLYIYSSKTILLIKEFREYSFNRVINGVY